MDDYLTKPFELRALWSRLARWRDVAVRRRLTPATSAIDSAAIRALQCMRPDDPTSSARVIRAFLRSSERLVTQLQDAIRTGDHQQVQLAAHSLKSACAYVGAQRARHMATDLETKGRAGQTAELGPIVATLVEELARATFELEQILKDIVVDRP